MAKSIAGKIREFIARNPSASPSEIATRLKVPTQYVYVVRNVEKKKAEKQREVFDPVPVVPVYIKEALVPAPAQEAPAPDMVNHPPHYMTGGIETIDFIEAKHLDYHLGNVVKYITRAGKKSDEIEDLKKARWYLDRAIAQRTNA